MTTSLASPLDHFNRFAEKQRIEEQFTEDIRRVIHGGHAGSDNAARGFAGSASRGDSAGAASRGRGMRARSPGLAAGAALALTGGLGSSGTGGGTAAVGGADAQSAAADSHSIARKVKEHARGSGCPWDDHSAFMRRGDASPMGRTPEEPSRLLQPLMPKQQRDAFQDARSVGRRNRDDQQKIGAAAPFDAPEKAFPLSTYSAASHAVSASCGAGVVPGGCGGAPAADHSQAYADMRREAISNKARMAGTDNLLAGNYLQTEGRTSVPVGRSSRPPQPERLLPQAMLKVQMDGLGAVSAEQAACLNARIMNEACRDRNTSVRLQLG